MKEEENAHRNFIGLLVVITLWVILWYTLTAIGKKVMDAWGHSLMFLLTALLATSYVLISYFPERAAVKTVNFRFEN